MAFKSSNEPDPLLELGMTIKAKVDATRTVGDQLFAIEDENYGANKENVWGLINAITGVSSHDSSHGVRDKLEIIASPNFSN